MGIYSGVIVLGGNFMRAIIQGVVVHGGIIQGQLSWEHKPRGNCRGRNLMGSNCSRENYSGIIILGVIVQGEISWVELSGRQLSRVIVIEPFLKYEK